jgi:type IV secretory pathway VirB10-like protein
MDTTPLPPSLITPPPPQPRQSKRVVIVGGCVLVGLGLVGIWWSMRGPRVPITREPQDRPASEQTVTSVPSTPPEDLRLATSYKGRSVPQAAQPPAAPPSSSPATQPVRTQASPPPATRSTYAEPRRLSPPTPVPPPPTSQSPQVRAVSPKPPGEEKPWRWFSPPPQPTGDILTPPFADEEGEKGGAKQPKVSKLFPQATWERPVDPTRVIYASQLLQGLLEQSVISGEASTVRIRLTETLYDKFGQLRVLLPLDTRILGTAEGAVKFGQSRLSIQVQKAELPDGTDLLLAGKLGDSDGRVGVPGDVNNHIPQLILATVITSALSIGAQASAGSVQGYNPTLEQQFATDISRGINSAGQQVVKRALDVTPTIAIPAQVPVTIQLQNNISLQTAPTIVRR